MESKRSIVGYRDFCYVLLFLFCLRVYVLLSIKPVPIIMAGFFLHIAILDLESIRQYYCNLYKCHHNIYAVVIIMYSVVVAGVANSSNPYTFFLLFSKKSVCNQIDRHEYKELKIAILTNAHLWQ